MSKETIGAAMTAMVDANCFATSKGAAYTDASAPSTSKPPIPSCLTTPTIPAKTITQPQRKRFAEVGGSALRAADALSLARREEVGGFDEKCAATVAHDKRRASSENLAHSNKKKTTYLNKGGALVRNHKRPAFFNTTSSLPASNARWPRSYLLPPTLNTERRRPCPSNYFRRLSRP